jgi:hypothetical protein
MKKTPILIIVLILTALVGYYFYNPSYFIEKKAKKTSNVDFLAEVGDELAYIWKNADLAGGKECFVHTEEFVDDSFYQCNPDFISCLLDRGLLKVTHQGQRLRLYSNIDGYHYVQRPTHREFLFQLIYGKDNVFEVRFKDTCREVYVPQRFYPFLLNNRDVTVEWDNFDKNIFVDKYLVRNWEALLWAKKVKNNEVLAKLKGRLPYEYVTNLNPQEMKSYCNFQGKKILSARLLDAISIHPEDIVNPKSRLFRAPYYPWSRKNSETILFKIQKNLSVENLESEKENLCHQVYSQDCLNRKLRHYTTWNSSWLGAYDIMGGPLEYVYNEINPRENIKLSSVYFPWKSKVHRTGIRGYWDGEGLSKVNFDFGKFNSINKESDFQVAFRCMRLR